jgi:hypothetical protein
MDSGLKAQQELEKIEEQITRLQAVEGQKRKRCARFSNCTIGWTTLRREISSQERVGAHGTGAASAASVHAGLCRAHFYRLERDSRRSRFSRRSGDCLRDGSLSRRGSCVVGQQKARDAKQRVYRNFGMPHPEGYRKALRVMKIAEKFKRPIFTFVDTDGAYPGLHAEERGQGEAIARNLLEMARLEVPIVRP